jgi:hypothetical protein
MTEPNLSSEQRRVLQLLFDAAPRGIPEVLWTAHGLNAELLSGLVLTGLATMAGDTVRVGGRAIEVVLVRITQAGREALES